MNLFKTLCRSAVAAALMGVGACALPAAGPTSHEIQQEPDPAGYSYFVIPVDTPIVQIMGDRREGLLPAAFHLRRYEPSIDLRPGDVIGVTIFETGGTSIFSSIPTAIPSGNAAPPPALPAPSPSGSPTPTPTPPPSPAVQGGMMSSASKTTALPPLTIAEDGDVIIPFIGRVQVAGLNPSGAAKVIQQALSSKAIRPQVIVSFVSNGTNAATVGGEANRPGPVTLSLRGERLLDVIGQAGGSKWPEMDTDVEIVRGRSHAIIKLQTIIDNVSENIIVKPNDQIFLTHNPLTFTVLGASQKVSQYTFDVARVSLAEAVGRAGGPIDTIGNPAAVYLFREEPVQIAKIVLQTSTALETSASLLLPDPAKQPPVGGEMRVKMIYKIDMNHAEGYFLAKRIMMRDKDLILIANAEATQLLKLFTIARGVTGIASDLSLFSPGGPLASSSGVVVTK